MKIVHFSELGSDTREEMKGARWILLDQDDIKNALSALMFAELDGVLVAVDHRKVTSRGRIVATSSSFASRIKFGKCRRNSTEKWNYQGYFKR